MTWNNPDATPPARRYEALAALLSVALVMAVAAVAFAQDRGSNVAATRHNLTAGGPGPVRVGGGGEPCQYCHTPHAASPRAPLWNREDPGTYYEPYASTTLVAEVGQPTGSSRLCLSCHDGTIALDQTLNSNKGGGTIHLSAQDRGYLGTDLRDDHPISFIYDGALAAQKPGLRDPAHLPPHLPLDHQGQLQCTTCHNPHDDRYGRFLRMDNRYSQLCSSCHPPEGYDTSAHATSTASLPASLRQEWGKLDAATVREAGCQSCHRPHSAGSRQRLLRYEAEEMNCLKCHDGQVASTDIASLIDGFSAHNPRLYTGVHDPTEHPATMAKHVECADCHNPHRVSAAGSATAPQIRPVMRGVAGATRSGQIIEEAQHEYQVCYRCHGDRNFAKATVQRVQATQSIAQRFNPANASFHPVEAPGRSNDVPSLLPPRTTADMIYCTDCHGSDRPDGPQGPHGSSTAPMLVAGYITSAPQMESPQAYALCYSCHSRASILNDESFPLHRQHVVDARMPCSACHTAHGAASQSRLIDFDADLAGPSQTTGAGPSFTDLGPRRGSCSLHCHGKEHADAQYQQ